MATRTIGLSEDAYGRLAALKGEGESFSDVVHRLTGGHLLRKLVGTMDADTARHYRDTVAKGRRRDEAKKRERIRRMLE